MGRIIEALEAQKKLLSGDGVPESLISEAELMLNLKFSDEYKEYLQKYGIAAYRGHELTGITRSPRLHVVAVTLAEREKSSDIPSDLYVVERTNVEEVVVWQNASGEIFYSGPNLELTKHGDSLSDYIVSA